MFLRRKMKNSLIKFKSGYTYFTPEKTDLILILGKTANGQSTFANYMTGVQMEIDSKNNLTLKPGQQSICKTKYSVESVTAFPQIVSTVNGSKLLDCPALDCNFDPPKKELSIFATHHAINQAKSIQGIVIIIDYHQIKYSGLGHLMNLLEKTISDFYQQKDSIMFLVNKAPKNISLNAILQTLKERADHEAKHEPGKTSKQMLYNLISSPKKLQLFDPTNANMRDIIATQLKTLKPLPKESINIQGYEEARIKLHDDIEALKKTFSEMVELQAKLIEEKAVSRPEDNINQSSDVLLRMLDSMIKKHKEWNSDDSLEQLEKLINDCRELIALKSLLISTLVKTDQNNIDQYKIAYKKILNRDLQTLDFEEAFHEIIADRVEASAKPYEADSRVEKRSFSPR